MLNLHFRQRYTQPVPRCLRCFLPRRFRERGYVPLEPLSVLPDTELSASLKQEARRIELKKVIAELLPRVACDGPRSVLLWNEVANGYGPGTTTDLVMVDGDSGGGGGQMDAWHSVLQRANSTCAAAGEEP